MRKGYMKKSPWAPLILRLVCPWHPFPSLLRKENRISVAGPSRSGALPTVYHLSGRLATVGFEPTQLDGFLAPHRARGYSYTVLIELLGVAGRCMGAITYKAR